ncbi:hypothetical protein AGMMS50267_14340 [Spirochaetia bacterium]|nr:hypothetical protein AGMMS50267_14340 [Spirochaetia bacterium]
MPFSKGQSGNPGGRPRSRKTVADALEKYAAGKTNGVANRDVLAKTLWDLATVDKDITAIRYIYDRLIGKPTETVKSDISGNMTVDTTTAVEKLERLLLHDH